MSNKKKKSQWGGKRPGAGRKPESEVALDATIAVCVTAEEKEIFKGLPVEKKETCRIAFRQAIIQQNKD